MIFNGILKSEYILMENVLLHRGCNDVARIQGQNHVHSHILLQFALRTETFRSILPGLSGKMYTLTVSLFFSKFL
jgi:hypothetical protein